MNSFKKIFDSIVSELNSRPSNFQHFPSIMDEGDYKTIKERSRGRAVILFGCGMGGIGVAERLEGLGILIDGICDNHRTGVFSYTGQRIMTPVELYEKYAKALVVISSETYEQEIFVGLRQLGFAEDQILPFPRKNPSIVQSSINFISVDSFIRTHYKDYEWAYDLLSDELSRSVLIKIIRKYLLNEIIPLSTDSPQYFEKGLMDLTPGEIFVDGGACYGDTSHMFAKLCQAKSIKYKHIYSFEPNEKCYKVAQNILLPHFPDIDIITKGLWNRKTELTFTSAPNAAASTMVLGVAGEKSVVSVISLDEFFAEKPFDDWPTFIKMDIEGAEQEALQGAKEVISVKYPKLAICVYHKPDDPYEIMRILRTYNPNYRYALRQCTSTGYSEQVLYAF